MSHTIGEARSVPQTGIEQMLGYLGKGFGTARNSMNKSYGLINLMFPDFKAGDLVIGESPELLEDMSFGKSLIEPSGHGFRLDSRLLDLIDVGIPVGALSGKFAKGFAKHGLEDLFKSKKFSKGERGYIGGKKSTAADLKALELAERMKKNGNGDLPIFQKTGWWLGHPDGKPRFEFEHGAEKYIDNNALYYRKYQIEDEHANNPEIGRYIYDPEWNEIQHMLAEGMSPYSKRVKNSPLEKHYPQRYDMIGITAEDDPGLLGSFNQPILEMMIKNRHPKYKKEMQSTFQHETQHAISGVEGFARGGTPKGVVKGLLRRVESTKKRMLKKNYGSWSNEDVLKLDKLNKFEKSLGTANYETSVALYKRLADESQARLVQERAHMTQAEMNADPFYKRYDTPLDRMLLFKQKTDPGKYKP